MRHQLACLLVVVCFLAALGHAQGFVRNRGKEEAIEQKLAATAPTAVETFRRATIAMDKRDLGQCVQLYGEVLTQAPQFSPALRRAGMCLVESGKVDEGLAEIDKAVQVERSPENLASLARSLAYPGRNQPVTELQKTRAFSLAKEADAHATDTDDSGYTALVAQLALDLDDIVTFRESTEKLVRHHPDELVTHYFHAILLAQDEKWIGAENEIKAAGRKGLPAANVEAFLNSGVHDKALEWKAIYYASSLIGAWLAGLLILFVGGKIFSALTLRFIEKADMNATVSSSEATLRRYYRALINLAGTYYYLSIPFVLFIVLAVAAGAVYGSFVLGRFPIKLLFIIVAGAVVTVYKMIQSLFLKVEKTEPGRALSEGEAPGLWSLTREVAEKLGTRSLDAIRVAPGTEMAVYERGSRSERRKGQGQRTLIMGVGLLPGFEQNSFRAVLAHEYGHLAHADTAGGDVALRVNQDMMKFAYAMAGAGQAVWWNLGFQFLRLYHFLFRRISHGATRLQEVLADRASARLYGAKPFEEGLKHVVRRQIEFNHFAGKEIEDAFRANRPLHNVYNLETTPVKDVEEAIQKALNRPTTEDDTHPSPTDRFRLVNRVVGGNASDVSGRMWDLFKDRDALTAEMSKTLESLVMEHRYRQVQV